MIRRSLAALLMLLSALLLQSSMFERFGVFGVSPNVILVVVVSLAVLESVSFSITMAFFAGALHDIFLQAPKGVSAVVYLVAAYLIGIARNYSSGASVWFPILAVAGGTLFASIFHAGLSVLLGQALAGSRHVIRTVFVETFLNTLLVPFIHPVVRRVMQVTRADRVLPWQ